MFVPPEEGILVSVEVKSTIGVSVNVKMMGVVDGVLDSAANSFGIADPKIGMDIRKERALVDTISNGSIGMIERKGVYIAET